MTTTLLLAGAFLLLAGGVAFASISLRRTAYRRSLRRGHDFVVLLVRVPKEAQTDEKNARTPQQRIAVAEALFSVLGGMRAQKGAAVALHGRHDHFAFEIVALKGRISFYAVVPKEARQFFEEQIHAQYPDAQIEEEEDYNAFTPQGVALGTELAFVRPNAFPLRTYTSQEGDQLNALTNALSRLSEDESGVIQYVVRSAHPGWHGASERLIAGLRSGKPLTQVMGRATASSAVGVLTASFKKEEKPLAERPAPLIDQALLERLETKTSKAGLEATIRVVVGAKGQAHARTRLQSIVDAFTQYRDYDNGNGLHASGVHSDRAFMERFIYRTMERSHTVVVNAEEMASLFHLPLPTTETPSINWLAARTLPAPLNVPSHGLYLGENIFRGERRGIHMLDDDRRRHMYIVGTTGTGKSVFLANMALQDIAAGKGVAVVDPHGSLVEQILENIPPSREQDVLYFDPADTEYPVGLNMLEATTAAEADFAVQEMIAIFYKLVTDPTMIGPMFEHNMRNAMLTLMANREHPGTIAEIPRIFTDTAYQRYAVSKVTDPVVRAFWEKEMAKTTDYHKSEMLGYLISKVGRFVENSMMRNIIGQPKSGFNFRSIMDEGKVLLVNLSKGRVGEINANLLGLIIVSKLQMAALARADTPEEQRKDFSLYIDEFQNFITDSIAVILSEARKYRLNLILAHQYINQLVGPNKDTKVRDAVFGNVGTMVAFRVGVDDTELLAQQFAPVVTPYDLVNIDRYKAYIRLLIENTASRAFTLATAPPPMGAGMVSDRIRQSNRTQFARPRMEVEREILERSRLGAPATQPTAPAERHG